MSEEEMRAIVVLKQWYNYNVEEVKEDFEAVDNAIKTILNLIEKQQKEIKNLKQENTFLKTIYSRTDEFKAIKKFAEGL